jgi:DNA-binding beta-propeller fold protein YncE
MRLLLIGTFTAITLLSGCEDGGLPTSPSLAGNPPTSTPTPTPNPSPSPSPKVVSTLAGSAEGNLDGTGSEARFRWPFGVAVAGDQSLVVADRLNHRIRRISTSGEVSALAGSLDGVAGEADAPSNDARFNDPQGLAIDASGSIYVADSGNHRIRVIREDGSVETFAGSTLGFADGATSSAQFQSPVGLALDAHRNLLVADRDNHRIRRITSLGQVETLTGGAAGFVDGPRSAARFNHPQGLFVAADGFAYVADSNNHSIRKVTPSGEVTTLAGNGTPGHTDGTGAAALFRHPIGLTGDDAGYLYVADWGNNCIRRIQIATGAVTTLAGTTKAGYLDGGLSTALFSLPTGIARTSSGSLIVVDYGNHRIRRIAP